ncbi:polyprenyl synthetase family protein [Saccharopolyspora sp. NPDC047091]|uniref:polyprenyl synthetase family protein n=1 Tax=Saccharopolyspora sp. NPDC047091 TaxID=3155924 RepID=UPI0034036D8D
MKESAPQLNDPADTTTEDAVDSDLPGQVQRTLAEHLDSRLAECAELDAGFAAAAREVSRFVLGGGKRIRPTFAWWGWRAAGGAASGPAAEAMLRAASALELIQACALVHDDLIDESDTRRGRPTVHREFAHAHHRERWAGGAAQFGMSAAVLLGDLALAWADDMLHCAGVEPAALARGLGPWRAMRTEMLAGQYLDVFSQVRGDETPEAALRVAELKSASYTVARPLQLGAEIAGADAGVLAALEDFGHDIGVAFQLRDDLLGVFGDPAVTGKPAGDDLREGKRTLLIAEALRVAGDRGDAAGAAELRSVLGDPDVSPERIGSAREVLVRLGAQQAVEDRIAQLTATAHATLRAADLAEPAATRLGELAEAVTDRTH